MLRTYLVSGAGSGIGRATAISLASYSSDNHLILLGRKHDKLNETKLLLERREQHECVVADICDREELKNALKSSELVKQNLCGIVANAGIADENQYNKNDLWDEIINTNLTGTYQLVNEILPYLRKSEELYKHIIFISSILARIGVPKYTAYCASKAGLIGLMRAWAVEFAEENILVNAICPGWVDTKMAKEGIQRFANQNDISFDQALNEQVKPIPLKKMSDPEEIASLVCYLLSNNQRSITGQSIDINNGALMV